MTFTRLLRRLACSVWLPLLCVPSAGLACRVPIPAEEVVFYDLPPNLPEDVTILEVSFLPSGPIYPGETARLAKVRRVVRGAYAGSTVKVLVDGAQSGGCRFAITSSKEGYIIGSVEKHSDGATYFRPIYETSAARAKRGGIQKPDPPMVQPIAKPFIIENPVWASKPTDAEIAKYRPSGKLPFTGLRVWCKAAESGRIVSCAPNKSLAPEWAAAAERIARLHRIEPLTREGWRVEGGELNFRIMFDPPRTCLGHQYC